MKHLYSFIIALSFAGIVHAEPMVLQSAVEAGSVQLIVDSEGKGLAIARECTGCPLQVTVDTQTTFKVNNRLVASDKALLQSGKGGTVVYEPSTRRAVLLLW